jgi:hypothetical protein
MEKLLKDDLALAYISGKPILPVNLESRAELLFLECG